MPINVFLCYAREDENLLKKLKSHLGPLQQQGLIDVWYDRDIRAGTEWEQEIKAHLIAAQIVLLLVSPDFMSSDYCYGIEMERALERHEKGEVIMIPIILRPTYWHNKLLDKLQALPTDEKPVTDPDWLNIDRALLDVTNGIYKVAMQLTSQREKAKPRINTPTDQQVDKVTAFQSPIVVNNLTLVQSLTRHTGAVYSVAINADGQTLVSGSGDKTIKVWDLPTGKQIRILTGHVGPVYSVAISPDGQTLVSGSDDKTIKVWGIKVS